MCAMWTPSSDASGTATTGTELLYEPKQASVTPSLVDTGKNEVTLKITPGRAIIKLDADLLSMYSPVLKDELQRRLQGGTEQRASFIRVSGDEVSWRTIKSMLLGQYDMNHESNMDLFDIARTLLIATTYELEIVKDVLVQEIL